MRFRRSVEVDHPRCCAQLVRGTRAPRPDRELTVCPSNPALVSETTKSSPTWAPARPHGSFPTLALRICSPMRGRKAVSALA